MKDIPVPNFVDWDNVEAITNMEQLEFNTVEEVKEAANK